MTAFEKIDVYLCGGVKTKSWVESSFYNMKYHEICLLVWEIYKDQRILISRFLYHHKMLVWFNDYQTRMHNCPLSIFQYQFKQWYFNLRFRYINIKSIEDIKYTFWGFKIVIEFRFSYRYNQHISRYRPLWMKLNLKQIFYLHLLKLWNLLK